MAKATSTVTYKPIPDYIGYRVGDDGSVWSCRKRGPSGGPSDAWHQLRTSRQPRGYQLVQLFPEGKMHLLHRLVLLTFVGPCPEGMEACHNDGNPANSALSNLRWATKKENMADRELHGRTRRGSSHRRSKITEDDVRAIRAAAANKVSQRVLAKRYGLGKSTVAHIINRDNWTHIE